MVDWGIGEYERTAAELHPASERLIEVAAVTPGERVLDVGTGTGNAALLAAQAGAEATGLDPAARLIDVARERAADAGLDATFVVGDALDLPFADATFDVAISVFGLIAVPDAERAASELMRVVAPGGRVVVSSWLAGGALAASFRVLGEAIRAATGAPAPAFDWSDPAAVGALFARHGARVEAEESEIAFRSSSPAAYFQEIRDHHPVAIAGNAVLSRTGAWEETYARALAILSEGNEDPAAFKVTSRYVITTAARP